MGDASTAPGWAAKLGQVHHEHGKCGGGTGSTNEAAAAATSESTCDNKSYHENCVQLSTTPLCMTDWNPRAKPNKDRGQKQYSIDKQKLNAVLHDGLEPERGLSTFDKVAKICHKPAPKRLRTHCKQTHSVQLK